MSTCQRALSRILSAAIGLALCGAQPALAADDSALEEVMVTAQKRSQDLQEVPLSIVALSSNDINERGMTDMTAIVQQTPGLGMIQFSPSVTVLSLRGVSQAAYLDHLEGPIAVYLDDSYVASNGAIAGSMFDMERIEVLRGPQGTLFGRNATGGLVHFVTKKPTEAAGGYLRLTGAEYSEFGVEGAYGGALGGDLLGRISYAYNHVGGYIKDTNGPDTPQQKNYAVRGQLSRRFGEDTEVLLSLRYSRNPHETADGYMGVASAPDADGLGVLVGPNENPWGTCNGCSLVGYTYPSLKGRERSTTGRGDFDRTVRGASLTITTTLGDANLTSVTDYGSLSKRWLERTDPAPFPVMDYFTTGQEYSQFSEELRVDGQVGKLQWVGGLYFLNMQSNNLQRTVGTAFGFDYLGTYQQDTRSEAVFGQVDYAFNDKWSMTLGGRASFDQKEMAIELQDVLAGASLGTYNKANSTTAKRDFNGFSGRLALNYQAAPDVLLYGSINRGYKGGNWTVPPFPPLVASTLPHGGEKLTSYEVGSKSTIADGRARLNTSAFYYDYKDYQAYTLVGGIAASVLNRPANVYGAEIELQAALSEGLTTELSYAYLHTKVDGITLPLGRTTSRQMPMSPKSSLNALVRYEWSALGGTLALQADGKYEAAQYFTTFNAPVDFVPSRFIANARASYTRKTESHSFEVALFARNLSDKLYMLYGADVSALGFQQYTLAPPRVFGASFMFNFD